MARKKKTGMIKWDEELAEQAKASAQMEAGTATGQMFNIKSGVLSFNGNPIANNEMAVIILDAVMLNVHYAGKYDPNNQAGPDCFAFGRDEKDMIPHEVVTKVGAQYSEGCVGCELNEWGSGDGRGKACGNKRRLGMIAAGEFGKNGFELYEDVHFEDAEIAYMDIPPTSIKGYAGFVKQLQATMGRPPHGVIAKVELVPEKSYFKVVFTAIEKVPDEVMGMVMERHKECAGLIEFPFTINAEEEAPKPKKRGKKAAAPKATRKARAPKKKAGRPGRPVRAASPGRARRGNKY